VLHFVNYVTFCRVVNMSDEAVADHVSVQCAQLKAASEVFVPAGAVDLWLVMVVGKFVEIGCVRPTSNLNTSSPCKRQRVKFTV